MVNNAVTVNKKILIHYNYYEIIQETWEEEKLKKEIVSSCIAQFCTHCSTSIVQSIFVRYCTDCGIWTNGCSVPASPASRG